MIDSRDCTSSCHSEGYGREDDSKEDGRAVLMSQSQRDQPATVRAKALFDRMGQRIGYFAALTTQQIQRATSSLHEEADQMDHPQMAPGIKSPMTAEAQMQEASQPATEKAEEMVDRAGQSISHYTALIGLQIQRAAARVREEAEDMWAEAQNIRHQNGRRPS